MFGMDNMVFELMSNKLEDTLAVIRQVMKQFPNPISFFWIGNEIFHFFLNGKTFLKVGWDLLKLSPLRYPTHKLLAEKSAVT